MFLVILVTPVALHEKHNSGELSKMCFNPTSYAIEGNLYGRGDEIKCSDPQSSLGFLLIFNQIIILLFANISNLYLFVDNPNFIYSNSKTR